METKIAELTCSKCTFVDSLRIFTTHTKVATLAYALLASKPVHFARSHNETSLDL